VRIESEDEIEIDSYCCAVGERFPKAVEKQEFEEG
jgi:hypothetical protein